MSGGRPGEELASPGKLGAFALVALALVALGTGSHEWILVAPLLAALAASPFVRFEGEVMFRTYILLGIPFAILARLHPVDGADAVLPLNIPFYTALYLQLVGIRKLASRTTNLAHVVFCGTSGLGAIGANAEKDGYTWLVALAALPLLLGLRGTIAHRPAKTSPRAVIVLALALLSVGAFAAAGTHILEINYEDLNRAFLSRMMRTPLPSAGGFSGAAHLGDMTGFAAGDEASEAALRVFAPALPGYLRGKCFGDYARGTWSEEPPGRETRPAKAADDARTGRHVLAGRRPPPPGAAPDLRVFPVSAYGKYFFLPLRAAAVETSSDLVRTFASGTLESPYDSTSSGYSVFTDRSPTVGGPSSLAVPEDAALRAALDRVLAAIGPRETTADLVQGIRDYFSEHYEYRVGIKFEPGSDPLVQFLNVKKHGHCELFASAGALLLRRRGVPARYVTGFLCAERSPWTEGLWIARQRHGHAWVEYDDRGWQTAEFTPSSGVPSAESSHGLEALLDLVSGAWDRLWAFVAENGPLGLLRAAVVGLGSLLVTTWPGRALLAALVILLGKSAARRLPRRARIEAPRVLPAWLEAERQRYLAFERSLARRGFAPRKPTETLEELARRLPEEHARVVREFAARRYAPFA